MQAIQVSEFSQDSSAVRLINKASAKPGVGEVLVEMLYSPINPSDFNFIRGDYHTALARLIWNQTHPSPSFMPNNTVPLAQPPYVPGGEGVGVVIASGGGWLADSLMGKKVAISAGPPNGAWQKATIVDAKKAIPVPNNMDDKQAAMLLINPLSCLGMIYDVLKVKPDSWLMQSGASSAMGKMVIRLSKELGFKTINLVRNTHSETELRHLGADVVININDQSIQQQVHNATRGQGVNYALDCIGGELLQQMLTCLSLNGHMLLYGTLASPYTSLHSRDLMMPCAKISGFFAGNWLASMSIWQKIILIRKLKKFAKRGFFDTEIAGVYPLEQYQQALQQASEPGKNGKVLFDIATSGW